MIKKNTTEEYIDQVFDEVKDGMTLMLGGFGICGIPERSIRLLAKKK